MPYGDQPVEFTDSVFLMFSFYMIAGEGESFLEFGPIWMSLAISFPDGGGGAWYTYRSDPYGSYATVEQQQQQQRHTVSCLCGHRITYRCTVLLGKKRTTKVKK